MSKKIYRNLTLLAGAVAAVGLLFWSDPAGVTWTMVIDLLTAFIAVGAALWFVKLWHPYPEADAHALFSDVRNGNTAAGLALIAKAILVYGFLSLLGGKVHAEDAMLTKAKPWLPALASEQRAAWPDHPAPWVLAGLIEQESCPKCWNPASRLRTAREEGAGLTQFTRAFRPNGSVRFDTIADLRARYPQMRELTWGNVYQRPDLQLRGTVLMSRDLYAKFDAAPGEAGLHFTDAAWNAGAGRIQRDRRACRLTNGCDYQQWFGHVERTCTASRVALAGYGRSPCQITVEHVANVFKRYGPRYRGML